MIDNDTGKYIHTSEQCQYFAMQACRAGMVKDYGVDAKMRALQANIALLGAAQLYIVIADDKCRSERTLSHLRAQLRDLMQEDELNERYS